jgi:hypothetical protein
MSQKDLYAAFGETFPGLSTLIARVLKSPALEEPEADDRRQRLDAA